MRWGLLAYFVWISLILGWKRFMRIMLFFDFIWKGSVMSFTTSVKSTSAQP